MKGCFTAIVTPFFNDAVDYESLEKLIENQIAAGMDGIVASGTTGESPTLSHKEDQEVVSFITKKVRGRIKVIAGTGSNATSECISLSKHADSTGVDGILVVTPYYNKPTQEGLYRHYAAVAKSVGCELIIYNIPGRTAVSMDIDTFKRLQEFKNINTVKEASGSVDFASSLKNKIPEYDMLSGNDSLNLPLLSIGAVGCISVVSNLYPQKVKQVFRFYQNSQPAEATALHHKLLPFTQAMFMESNPIPIKHACYKKKLIASNQPRLPLVSCSPSLAGLIEEIMDTLDF